MPQIGQVAVVDTEDFGVISNIDAGGTPVRMALHPDGRSLWVTNDSEDGTLGGITVVDVATLKVVARLATGSGPHEIVFSGEVAASHGHGPEASSGTAGTTTYAFVANRRDGTISVVDTQAMELDTTVNVSAPITGLDYASASNAVYVAGEGDAGLTVIDASRHEIVGSIATSPGVESIRFAPGGRWGFAVSAANDSVDVIDATTNRVVHTVHVPGAPDRVSFSATHAFVHASERPDVAVIELAHLGGRETLEAVTVIGGEMPPVQSPVQLSVADAIVPVHEHGGHVLIANPGDKSIYYYMAGMNAPMQAFTNYGRSPRAVGVIDRSMRETAPGVYSARVRVPGSGQYQVAFQLDSPRVVHCFAFTAGTDPRAGGDAEPTDLGLQVLSTEREVKAGDPLTLKVAVVDTRTNEPVSGIDDLTVMATLASGQRSERFGAAEGAPGTYEAQLRFSLPGVYNVYFAMPSRGIGAGDLPSVSMRVTPGQPE
jgi:YVTN family beta-propeller protein